MGTVGSVSSLLSSGLSYGSDLYKMKSGREKERDAGNERQRVISSKLALRDKILSQELSKLEKEYRQSRSRAIVGFASRGVDPFSGSAARRLEQLRHEADDRVRNLKEREEKERAASNLVSRPLLRQSGFRGGNFLLRIPRL